MCFVSNFCCIVKVRTWTPYSPRAHGMEDNSVSSKLAKRKYLQPGTIGLMREKKDTKKKNVSMLAFQHSTLSTNKTSIGASQDQGEWVLTEETFH